MTTLSRLYFKSGFCFSSALPLRSFLLFAAGFFFAMSLSQRGFFTFTLRGRISGARNGNKIHLLALHVNELVRRAQGVAISAPPASYFTPQFQSFPHLQKNTIISP
jgi:hypothetical protein